MHALRLSSQVSSHSSAFRTLQLFDLLVPKAIIIITIIIIIFFTHFSTGQPVGCKSEHHSAQHLSTHKQQLCMTSRHITIHRTFPRLKQLGTLCCCAICHTQGFWSQIQGTLALLPCFGINTYLINRLSSTIIASIITATPMIATRQLLGVYTFLKEEHVILRGEQEDEVCVVVVVCRRLCCEQRVIHNSV
jgi:hypothetical protein